MRSCQCGHARRGVAVIVEARRVDEAVTQIVVEDSTEGVGIAGPRAVELRSVGDLDVIAMTGSVGKATTKDLLLRS